jgi:hypothetical protein
VRPILAEQRSTWNIGGTVSSYVLVHGNPTAGTGDGSAILALVVTDGTRTQIFGDSAIADSLRDVDWPVGLTPFQTLQQGLHGMSYYSLSGPTEFEDVPGLDSGKALARLYNLD